MMHVLTLAHAHTSARTHTHTHLYTTNPGNTKTPNKQEQKICPLGRHPEITYMWVANTSRDWIRIVNNRCGPGSVSRGSHYLIPAYCCCQARTQALACDTFQFFRSNPDFYGSTHKGKSLVIIARTQA